jgi:CBS-domain-containing membrane protein
MLYGVVLAAGASTRMGKPKATLPIGPGDDIFVTRLAAVLRDGGADGVTVGDVMTRGVAQVDTSASIAEAAEMMARQGIHGLPVVDGESAVAGMVSSLDVAGWVAGLTNGKTI